jgi:hypothetical protein
VKAAHLEKIEARRKRVKSILAPDTVNAVKNLAWLLGKLSATSGVVSRGKAEDVRKLLDDDVPELIQEIRDLNQRLREVTRMSWYLTLEAEAASTAGAPPGMERATREVA